MRLRTDDDIYRARLVYLGPPGYTLPVHLPYAQYGLFMLLVPLYMFIHWLFTLRGRPLPGLGDRARHRDDLVHLPARRPRPAGPMVIRTALTDWRRTREPAASSATRAWSASRVGIREELA